MDTALEENMHLLLIADDAAGMASLLASNSDLNLSIEALASAITLDSPNIWSLLTSLDVPKHCGGTWLAKVLTESVINDTDPAAAVTLKEWTPTELGLAACGIARLKEEKTEWGEKIEKCLVCLRELGAPDWREAEGDLERAAMNNSADEVRAAFARGARPRSPSGSAAIMNAMQDPPEALEALLAAGVPANGPTTEMGLRLAHETNPRAQAAIDRLRRAGADMRPLATFRFVDACAGQDFPMVIFTHYMANEIDWKYLQVATRKAAESGLAETVVWLAQNGASISPVDNGPLVIAANKGRLNLVKTLISLGADPTGPIENGEPTFSALYRAKMGGQTETLEWLIQTTNPPQYVLDMIERIPVLKN